MSSTTKATELVSARKCAGLYEITLVGESDPGHRVTVTQFSTRDGDTFTGWVAQAAWNSNTCSDPCDTLRAAKKSARIFLTSKWA